MPTTPMLVQELQTAVQTALTGDATLMAMITGVFQVPPEGQTPPYISYGQHVDGGWPSFGKMGSEALFLLDIFSQAGDDAECYAILAEVRRILQTSPTNPPLAMPSWGQARMTYEWSTIIHEQEYSIRHMPVRFRSKAQEL